MSEELALPPSGESKYTTPTDNEVKSENAAAPKATAQKVYDDDLEDGEIDDEDENDEHTDNAHSKIIGAAPTAPVVIAVNKPIQPLIAQKIAPDIDAGDKKSKYKKHNIVEDDFAGSIESAIAAALKKNGIMPPMPKMLESRDEIDKQSDKDIISSKSSRRRKRRKLREKEKEKEKKKHRPSSPGNTLMGPLNDDDVDDDEMLCIRGGSPPPAGLATPLPQLDPGMSKKEGYDTDQTYTSYDSYDSGHNYSRYSSSRKKDGNSGSRSGRKERSSSRRDDDRRSEKRSRRNYDDSASEDKYQDRHPQQPRKMELCKFYLMECCAKKDKCSYMHSDFPCKYYYLGKDCVYRSACKFSHGKPLTEQLRNILLKHLETAPKEILGTFRRISRENALHLMNTTHERLCEEHGVENTLNTSTNQSIIQSQATGMRNGDLLLQQQQNQNQQASPAQQQHQQHHQQQHQQQHQHQQQQHQHHLHQHHQQQQHQQQQQQQQQQHNQQSEIIPSLLDMVINIPPATSETPTNLITNTVPSTTVLGQSKAEKQRKSRWCDSNAAALKQTNLEPPSSSAPSYLDLKNLIGILSTDRIEKLSQLGVVNLEQINQLTLSQLNNIGLTVTEINEIQLNAQNMARLGVPRVNGDVGTANLPASGSSSIPSSQDVDMRFLPSCLPLTTTSTTTITTSHDPSKDLNNDIGVGPTDQQIHTSGVMELTDDVTTSLKDSHSGASNLGGIDYSQYLRDSNLGYDKNDLLDDERDEEQLVIDDQDMDTTDDNSQANQPEAKDDAENDAKSSAGFSYGCDDSNDVRLPPAIHLSEQLQSLLKDPGNLYTVNVSALLKSTDALTGKIESDSIKSKASSSKHDDGGFYGAAAVGRDIDSRHEYRESRATDYHEDNRDHRLTDKKDEFRDPRLSSRSNEQGGSTSFSYRPNNSDNESDRSKSSSPTLAQQMENYVSIYERKSMYDWTPKCEQEDLEYSRRNIKADKDMRLSGFLDSPNSDIDLRLPFQPVKNMQIANEIDGSISALMPITYKISEIDVPEPKYSYLRHSFQCDDSTDPRLRRILGLPELSNSKVLAALGSSSRPTIASPSSVESSSSPTREKEIPSTSIVRGPRVDPRRAAAAAAATSTSTTSGGAQIVPAATSNPQQNVEIRMLLQKSDWYKNLNSKYKIMVNQQLALVSTELKRFHQDPSPNKVFDIQFIVNNQNLQQILTNLGIFIDDNGQVAHIENDIDMMVGTNYGSNGNPLMMMNDQNMSIQQRMAMQHQIEFLRGPPPNINMLGLGGGNAHGGPGPQQGMFGGPGGMMTPTFDRNPRYSLLGIPPGGGSGGGGGYNPFAGNPGENGGGAGLMDAGYCGLNNPFANNFGGNDSNNSGNFGGQPINRGNRNNFNRQGGNGNGGNRMNRRNFKPNNQRDRRGGGGGGGGSGGVNQNNNKGMDEL